MDKDTQVMSERCHAKVSKRWSKVRRRCKFTTNRGLFCWQHEKQLRGFRIKKSNKHSGFGLFTTEDIPANRMICGYEGDKVVTHDNVKNPYMPPTYIDASRTNIKQEGRWVKDPKGPNNAEIVLQDGKAYLYSTKDIPANTEITAAHKIAEAPKPIPEPAPIPAPKPKRKIIKKPTHRALPKPSPIVKSKQEKRDNMYEKKSIIRLQFIRKLFLDPTFAKQLGLTVNPKKTVTIPKRDDLPIDKYFDKLHKKIREQELLLMKYIQSNPKNKTDKNKIIEMIDALIKKKKPKLQKE